MVTADFDAYRATQRAIDALWQDRSAWWRRAVLNTARMGWFSADRAILDYARDVPAAGAMTPFATDREFEKRRIEEAIVGSALRIQTAGVTIDTRWSNPAAQETRTDSLRAISPDLARTR